MCGGVGGVGERGRTIFSCFEAPPNSRATPSFLPRPVGPLPGRRLALVTTRRLLLLALPGGGGVFDAGGGVFGGGPSASAAPPGSCSVLWALDFSALGAAELCRQRADPPAGPPSALLLHCRLPAREGGGAGDGGGAVRRAVRCYPGTRQAQALAAALAAARRGWEGTEEGRAAAAAPSLGGAKAAAQQQQLLQQRAAAVSRPPLPPRPPQPPQPQPPTPAAELPPPPAAAAPPAPAPRRARTSSFDALLALGFGAAADDEEDGGGGGDDDDGVRSVAARARRAPRLCDTARPRA